MYMSFDAVSGKTRSLVFLAALILFVGGIAIADIISGLSTTNSSTNVTITNLTLNKPSDAVVGDVMLANVAIHDGNAVTVSPPTGWNQILRTDNETNVSIVSYWKVVGASEPANYVWTLSPQTRAQGGITRYSGVDTANPIDVAAGNSGRGTVATTSSVTTAEANEMVVAVYALHVGGNNHAGDFFAVPVGMTERYDASYTAAGPTIAEFDGVQAVAGSTGIKSSDIAGNRQRDWVSQVIALRPEIPTTLSDGLIHYWKLDESSGDAFDAAGNMTLTNMNTTSFVPAKINNGSDFEKDVPNYFEANTDLVASPLTAYTACFWMSPETKPSGGEGTAMWASYDTPGVMDIYYVNFGSDENIVFRHYTPLEASTIVFPVNLTLGEFYHVCGSWDGSTMRLYINESLVSYQSVNTIRTNADTNGTAIGGQPLADGSTAPNSPFDGVIDEVGFWTRALTASEINELYNGGTGRTHPF